MGYRSVEVANNGREDAAVVTRCVKCKELTSVRYCNLLNEWEERFLKQEVIKVVFGIHPDEVFRNYRHAPLRQEVFYYCYNCGAEVFNKIALAIPNVITVNYENDDYYKEWLLRELSMPEYQPGYGHWITYWEKKGGADGKYFCLQFESPIFLQILEDLKDDFFGGEIYYEMKETSVPAKLS